MTAEELEELFECYEILYITKTIGGFALYWFAFESYVNLYTNKTNKFGNYKC